MNRFQNVELFVIEHGDKYILFAPLQGMVLLMNGSAISLLKKIISGKVNTEDKEIVQSFISSLENRGLKNEDPKKLKKVTRNIEFCPTSVMLDLTSNCNLHCVYCYAMAGDEPKTMSWECAKSAINFVYNNAVKQKSNIFEILFHGTGEPTFEWTLLKKCIEYAKHLNRSGKVKHFITRMTTNGVYNKEKAHWIVNNIGSASLSFDGMKEIQDTQRPFLDGSGSFDIVYRTAKIFHNNHFPFSLRSSITEKNVGKMKEMVIFFNNHFPGIDLNFEPLVEVGRCVENAWNAPSNKDFISEFLKAKEYANKNKINLGYSGAPGIGIIQNKFCGVPEPSFDINYNGIITTCSGYSHKIFQYGSFNSVQKEFIFDFDKIEYIKKMVPNMSASCQNCFCKWQCAGDCPGFRLLKNPEYAEGVGHCEINRAILKWQLLDKLK